MLPYFFTVMFSQQKLFFAFYLHFTFLPYIFNVFFKWFSEPAETDTQGECLSTCFWLCSASSYTSFGMSTFPVGLIIVYVFFHRWMTISAAVHSTDRTDMRPNPPPWPARGTPPLPDKQSTDFTIVYLFSIEIEIFTNVIYNLRYLCSHNKLILAFHDSVVEMC